MYSFQRLIEMPEVKYVRAAPSPPEVYIELHRNSKGVVTHFQLHLPTGVRDKEPYSSTHPYMLSQFEHWVIHNP